MKIGYPCINRRIGCSSGRTFRLASYADERLRTTVASNIRCLEKILHWNIGHGILFFRITSDLVPFASHPVCTFPWQEHFREEFAALGDIIRSAGMRISMHPDQFILLNAPDPGVTERSIAELRYHAAVLDLLGLDDSAKIQIHIGGVYGDAEKSIARFARRYPALGNAVRRRLVVENDDRRFTAADCLGLHQLTGIPVLFDFFHHSCRNNSEETGELVRRIRRTWRSGDGIMMADYSSQNPQKRAGSHAERIDPEDFRRFLAVTDPCDLDVMLEIKDKEQSALAAVALAGSDPRFAR